MKIFHNENNRTEWPRTASTLFIWPMMKDKSIQYRKETTISILDEIIDLIRENGFWTFGSVFYR